MEFNTAVDMAAALAACPVCKKEFDEGGRTPLSLPGCRHVSCLACLATLAMQEVFSCPKCHREVSLGPQGFRGLHKDVVALNCVEFVELRRKVKRREVFCTECPEKAVAKYRCQECRVSLCPTCNEGHFRVVRARAHRILELGIVVESTEVFIKESESCPKHGNENLRVFCRTCDKSLCTLCQVEEHQGHQIEGLDIAYKEALARNEEYQDKLKQRGTSLKKLQESQGNEIQRLQQSKVTVKDAIHKEMTTLREDLDRRERALLTLCDAAFQRDHDRLQKNWDEVARAADGVAIAVDCITKAERMTRPAQFLALMQVESRHVEHLLSRPEEQPLRKAPPYFRCSELQALRQGISQMGQLGHWDTTVSDVGKTSPTLPSPSPTKAPQQTAPGSTAAAGPPVYLSKEKANTKSCDVTATTLSTATERRSEPCPPRFARYPGTVVDLPVTADTKLAFLVQVSMSNATSDIGNVAEVALGSSSMRDEVLSVCERGGSGVKCRMSLNMDAFSMGYKSGGSLCVESWSRGTKETKRAVTHSGRKGGPIEVHLAFVLKRGTLTVTCDKEKLCELQDVPVPGKIYVGLWELEGTTSQLRLVSGEDLRLHEGFLDVLPRDNN